MFALPIHVGMRTVKTGLAVMLAVMASSFLGSQSPIFAVIAAIAGMNRTISGSFAYARGQLLGNIFGAAMGFLFALLVTEVRAMFIGLGVILIILFCNKLKMQDATPLSCIVFAAICLNMGQTSPLYYSFNRLFDTSVGLLIAISVNILVRPYDNRRKIRATLEQFRRAVPPLLEDRLVHCHIPELTPLSEMLSKVDSELVLFETERLHRQRRKAEAAYLRGCQQLAVKMFEELSSLCHMDSTPLPSEENQERLALIGVKAPESGFPGGKCSPADTAVLDFHLKNLMDADSFLETLLDE